MKILLFFSILLLLVNCNQTKDNSSSSSFWDDCNVIAELSISDNDTIIICDFDKIIKNKNVPLDLLVDSLVTIPIHNFNDEGLIGYRLLPIHFSDNYFCISAYSHFPLKLYDKNGFFVRNIGNIGQGPGEYAVVDNIYMDEKHDRIYILPFSVDYILEYDFMGNFYGNIPLYETNMYGSSFRVDIDEKQILFIKPVSKVTKYCVWIQNFSGEIIQGILASDYYSNNDYIGESTLTRFHTNEIEIYQLRFKNSFDYFYHYDIYNNRLKPKFKLLNADEYTPYFVYESPSFFVVEAGQSSPKDEDVFTRKIIIDKKTLKGCYFDGFVTNCGMLLGNGQYDLMNTMYDGYFSLIDFGSEIERYLSKVNEDKLTLDQKEKMKIMKELIISSKENDDDCSIVFKGRLK